MRNHLLVARHSYPFAKYTISSRETHVELAVGGRRRRVISVICQSVQPTVKANSMRRTQNQKNLSVFLNCLGKDYGGRESEERRHAREIQRVLLIIWGPSDLHTTVFQTSN
jgi:hypothetical protein